MRDWRKTLVSSVEYMKLFFNEDQFHRFIFFTLLVSSAFTRQKKQVFIINNIYISMPK